MESSNADDWIKVSRKARQGKFFYQNTDSKVRATKHYWNGFDENGNARWYIELSDGTILSQSNKDYNFWSKRYFPRKTEN